MTDLTPERITAFFDRVAADWDEMRLVYYDEAVIEHLAAAAELDETMTVADIGTGTGFVAAGLAGRVARVIGRTAPPARTPSRPRSRRAVPRRTAPGPRTAVTGAARAPRMPAAPTRHDLSS